jgi:hypothetical protein
VDQMESPVEKIERLNRLLVRLIGRVDAGEPVPPLRQHLGVAIMMNALAQPDQAAAFERFDDAVSRAQVRDGLSA